MTWKPWGIRSPSLFTRIFILLMVCLGTAFAINTIKALVEPPPIPETYSLAELSEAFRLASTGTELEKFETSVTSLAPSQGGSLRDEFLAHSLADALGLAVDQVRFDSGVDGGPAQGKPGPPPDDRFGRWPVEPDRDNTPGAEGYPPDFTSGPPSDDRGRPPERVMAPSGPEGREDLATGAVTGTPFEAGIRLRDGNWRIVKSKEEPFFGVYARRTFMWLFGGVLIMIPVAHYFARSFTEPIKAFARAAESLGRNPNGPPIAVDGPAELGAVARSFNLMQERLRAYVQERTEMVGAIAHDLRTPLTRLAFRIEAAPESIREKAAEDIAEMEAMIQAAMAFVRDGSDPGERAALELRSLLESITDDMVAVGFDVTLEAGETVVIDGVSLSLKRLFTNLVANAVKFGSCARIRLSVEAGQVTVYVDDDGPGLPETELERVFDPFYRTDPSRNRKTGGIGLGLAVARTIASAHGGKVRLVNLPERGLRAIVQFTARIS